MEKQQTNKLKGDKILSNILYVCSFLVILFFMTQSVISIFK